MAEYSVSMVSSSPASVSAAGLVKAAKHAFTNADWHAIMSLWYRYDAGTVCAIGG